jgi:periplasmic protein TonB
MDGVYRSVFEQSLVIDQGSRKPWNFLASLSAELLVVSLALLIPLLYSDHIPIVHWKDVMVGPPPSPPPVVPPTHTSDAANTTPSLRVYRSFVFNHDANLHPAPSAAVEFTPDAPPIIGVPDGIGGRTNMLGTYIPNVVALPPPPSTTPTVDTHKPSPLAVGGDVQMAKVVHKVIPDYLALAKSARISGVVRLVGIIGKDGTIQNLQLVSGHPLLARAAMEAVRQWVYKPTLLNGIPVDVIAPIEVRFTLGP